MQKIAAYSAYNNILLGSGLLFGSGIFLFLQGKNFANIPAISMIVLAFLMSSLLLIFRQQKKGS